MNQPQVQPVAWYPQPSAYQQMNYNQQAQLPQLPQQYSQPAPALVGRTVKRAEDIRPDDVPMDGRVGYFPMEDLSCVIAKQWTNEGRIATVEYIPRQPAPAPEVTNDAFSQDILARLDKIQEMLTEKKAAPRKESTAKE